MIQGSHRQGCAAEVSAIRVLGRHPHVDAVARDQRPRDVLHGRGQDEDEPIAIDRQWKVRLLQCRGER